jgi:hypothetical protein
MIDTTFRPITGNTYVAGTAVQVATGAEIQAVSTFRVRNPGSGVAYLAWGPASGVSAPSAPASGNKVTVNSLGLGAGLSIYVAVPPGSFFIASSGASFEVQGGAGGTGG